MGEYSKFWNSPPLGDSTEAPYDAPTEFAEFMISAVGADRSVQMSGVLSCVLDEYSLTVGVGEVVVGRGKGFVWGSWHYNDAPITFPISTPTVASRWDQFVLRKDWDTQTVRITRIVGTEGGGLPSVTKIVGDKWDFPLGNILVTTGGVITLSNEEGRLVWPLPNTTMPEVKVTRTADQAIASGGAIISWQTGTLVKDEIWSAATPTRLTVKRGGLYHLEVFLSFAAFNGFERGITPLINGEVFVSYQAGGFQSNAAGSTKWNLSCYLDLLKDDYIEIHAYQNTGSPLDLLFNGHANFPFPRARLLFIRPSGTS